jgi:hypothetical protein
LNHKNTGIIIVDSIAMLYRLAIGQTKKVWEINKQLGMQLSYLTEIARKNKIPILVTNQVYADFENKDEVNNEIFYRYENSYLPNKLEELGVVDGDTIMLGNLEFEYKK